jgi:hypothetical protein
LQSDLPLREKNMTRVIHFPVRPRGAPAAFATDPAAPPPTLEARGRRSLIRCFCGYVLLAVRWIAFLALTPVLGLLFALGGIAKLPLLACAGIAWLLVPGTATAWWLATAAVIALVTPALCCLGIAMLTPPRAPPKPLALVDDSPPEPLRCRPSTNAIAVRWLRRWITQTARRLVKRVTPGKLRLRLVDRR